MKKDLKNRLLNFPGFEALCRTLTRNHVRTLMYHRFSQEFLDDSRFIDRETLRSQIKFIRDRHDVVDPDQHLRALRGEKVGFCPVAVTADDGYADFYEVAFPVFSEFDIPAMLFVTTGFVSGKTWFWWDQLAHIMDTAPSGKYALPAGGREIDLDLTSREARKSTWHLVADRCRFMKDHDKKSLIADLAAQLGLTPVLSPPQKFSAASWDQIREMAGRGIQFGAHTVHHPILSRVPAEEAKEELCESQSRLAEELGRPVNWFAYPQGGPADFNADIKATVGRYFDGCYVAYQQMENRRDAFTMPRYCITDNLTDFRWVLCGAEFIGLTIRRLFGLRTGATEAYWSGSTEGEELQ